MKNKSVFAITFLIASMLLVVQVSAEIGDNEFVANGKMTHYSNYLDPDRGSEIVGGTWRVEIGDGVVDFNYFYKELNLREEVEYSPVGSIDKFKGYLTSDAYVIGEGFVEIWGEIHVDKMMWFLDEYSDPLPDWLNPEWIPEHAPKAWITDFIVRDVHITITPDDIVIENGNLDKHGITLSYHPRARAELTFMDLPTVMTYEDTIPAGYHLSEVIHRLWIYNIDDITDTDIVDPGFHVETEGVTLTGVDWEQYADWGDTYADWDFPEEFTIPEDHGGDGPNFGVDLTEPITLDFEMNRPTDQPVIDESGTYEASFTLKFTDIDCEWCNGFINTNDPDVSIVPGSFWTDAPLQDSGEDGNYVWFFLDLDSLVTGVEYHFSVDIDVVVTDETALPILYKPGIGINYLVSTEWRNGVEGDTVEIPPDMRPEYITAAWVSTDASHIWTLGRRNEINAYMHEVVVEQIL